jgi:Caspase domain
MTTSFESFRPLAACFFSAAIGLTWSATAHAQAPSVPHPHAYGIIVGNNSGGPGQQPLRYAEDDATRMAQVLRDVGRFGTTDLRVLTHPDGPKILATIDEIGQKVREDQQRGEQAVVVFYYSGHAKASAFTLGDSELPLATLRERLRQLPSTLTLVVLDACQSGAFARTKGAEPAADFSFNSVSHLTTKGIAVMASSTGQELSQESDALKSSYFTHHLIVALRGAGDADGDGRVSLDEAYRYAYRRTLAATARTRVGTQHVTLETDLSGQGDVAVTYPSDAKSQLELPASLDARVLVQHAPSGSVAAELQKAPGAALRLALPAGQYDATLRTKGKAVSCHLALADNRVTAIDLGACSETAASGIAKGDTDDEMSVAAFSESPREPDRAAAAAPASLPIREIDRWGAELTTGLLWRTYDAYTTRLGDFGYERDKDLLGLPSGRFVLGASRLLVPHVTMLVQVQTLAGDSFSRNVGGYTDKLGFKGYGGGVYVRAHADVLHDWLQAYLQVGAGPSFVTSSFDTRDQRGPYTTSESSWGYLLGVGGGLVLAPRKRASVFLQVAYDRAPALQNLIGDTHDVGGPSASLGMQLRFGQVDR